MINGNVYVAKKLLNQVCKAFTARKELLLKKFSDELRDGRPHHIHASTPTFS